MINSLKDIELFKNIEKSDLEEILKNSIVKKYKKENVIYLEGDTCKTYDIILDGKISIQDIDEDGNLNKLCDFNKGDVLGDVLIFSIENTYPMNVICVKDCEILHLNKEILIKICQLDEFFLKNFLEALSNKAVVLKNKIKILTSKNLREKIINFLLKQEKIQQTKKIKLNMTKTELASFFNVQRPSLSRELKNMKEDNLIDFDTKTITIINL